MNETVIGSDTKNIKIMIEEFFDRFLVKDRTFQIPFKVFCSY